MAEDKKLDSLLERVYQDGVEKSNKKAEEIISNAKSEADKILKDAEAKSEEIIKEAERKAEELKKKHHNRCSYGGRAINKRVKTKN